jgi:hypothetical protein
VLFTGYYEGGHIKKDVIVMACRMHGRYEKYILFLLEIQKGRDHLGDLGVDRTLISWWSLKK